MILDNNYFSYSEAENYIDWGTLRQLRNLQKILDIELIITTSRPKSENIYIRKILKNFKIKYKTIITDLMHSKRILINDFAISNTYPSSMSINIPINSNGLSLILESVLKK